MLQVRENEIPLHKRLVWWYCALVWWYCALRGTLVFSHLQTCWTSPMVIPLTLLRGDGCFDTSGSHTSKCYVWVYFGDNMYRCDRTGDAQPRRT